MLTINPSFKNLLPPLSIEERNALTESLVEDGCFDPLWVWRGQIVDGHNRYEICQEHGIPFEVREMDFDDEDAVMDWIDKNQIARRNLSPDDFRLAVGRRYNRTKHTMSEAGAMRAASDNLSKAHTAETIAKDSGVDERTVRRAGKLAEAVEEVEREEPDIVAHGREEILARAKEIQRDKAVARREQIARQKLRYQQERVSKEANIIRDNAVDWLMEQDSQCDLLITDPPYSTDVDNISQFASGWLPLALSKVKDTGSAYVFVGAYPEELHAYLSVKMPTQVLVWTYRNTIGPSAKARYSLNWQAVLYYCGENVNPLRTEELTEKWAVLDFNAPDGRHGNRVHKWQKPDDLAELLIGNSTDAGNLVYDCFAGSGTFLYKAAKMGREASGCDLGWGDE